MNRILKNNTGFSVAINDAGITIAAWDQYIIPANDYGLWEASTDVITKLTDNAASPLSSLTASDGSIDLAPNDGVRLILGEWSRQLCDGDNSAIKANVIPVFGKNRLCVDTIASGAGALIPALTSKLRYEDINESTGGVARGATITSGWTPIYQYVGSGLLHGFLVNVETKDQWRLRMVVDDEEVLGSDGMLTNDMIGDAVYDIDNESLETYSNIGIHFGEHDKIMWGFTSLPLRFYSSLRLYLRRTGANKKFRAGLMVISKD